MGNVFYPAGQSVAADAAFTDWLRIREEAFKSATPMLKSWGIMDERTTMERVYYQPVGPVALGEDVTIADGDPMPTGGIQGYHLTGTCVKRGVKGLRLMEEDRLQSRIPYTNMNVQAYGRAEKLYEDKKGIQALQAGTTQTGFDNVAFFSTSHPRDPLKPGVNLQSNSFTLALTPDNLATVIATVLDWEAENGDPLWSGIEPEFMLLVPPALRAQAHKAVDRENVVEGGAAVENISKGAAEVKVIKQLKSDPTRWYLVIKNAGTKPLCRVVYRPRQRFDLGPGSDLFQKTQIVELASNEWTDYRTWDWRTAVTSKP